MTQEVLVGRVGELKRLGALADQAAGGQGSVAETDTAGASGLQYDATTGTYTYVWKTSKASKGTCQVFTLGLNDGTFHTAIFDYVN